MNVKQEAEKYLKPPLVMTENGRIIIPVDVIENLLKELEAAEKVVEAAEKLTGQQLYGTKAFSKYWMELKEALKEYKANQGDSDE